jgi:transcriptional regulator of acetoin/glycerol metabolism
MYYFIKRGETHYWSHNRSLVQQAWHRAMKMHRLQPDWPEPGPISKTESHPSFLGPHWQITTPDLMGVQ